jgi:hypothetical protein
MLQEMPVMSSGGGGGANYTIEYVNMTANQTYTYHTKNCMFFTVYTGSGSPTVSKYGDVQDGVDNIVTKSADVSSATYDTTTNILTIVNGSYAYLLGIAYEPM